MSEPDTSPGDEIDEILRTLTKNTTLADRAAELATTPQGVKDASNRFTWSMAEAKDRLNRLMLTRVKDELEKVQKAADKVERMDTCGCDEYLPKRIAATDAQLNKEENNG